MVDFFRDLLAGVTRSAAERYYRPAALCTHNRLVIILSVGIALQ